MKTDYFFLFLEVISCNFFQFLSNIIPSYFYIVTKTGGVVGVKRSTHSVWYGAEASSLLAAGLAIVGG